VAKVLLDEDMKARVLVRLLTAAGHDVVTTSDLDLDGHIDPVVLARAASEHRILITYNGDDFRALHDSGASHAGVVLVYREHRNVMSYAEIVRALDNILASYSNLDNSLHVLNQWVY